MKATQAPKLIDLLLSKNGKWISASLLSSHLSISTRQIRKYIYMINEEAGCNLVLSSKAGYQLNIEEYRKVKLLNIDKDEDETPINRQNYIIQKLIREKNGYDIFDLADELYVSDATIENDLTSIRKIIKEHNLTLKREKQNIKMIGTEKQKRKMMSYLISSDSYDNFVLKDEVKMLTYHYHFLDFRTTIMDIFAENDIFVNDYTLNNTALHLIITIDRIRNYYFLDEYVDMTKIINTQQYKVAKEIKEYIVNTYVIDISDAELYNLTLVISNNTTMIDYSFITSGNISDFIEPKYLEIANEVIKNIEDCYCLDRFDEDFINKFTIHIKNMFNRVRNNYSAKNPLTSKIKTTYPLIYDIAVSIAQSFKCDYEINLTEDEITFIAFHIGSYFENNAQSKTKIRCAFIYADYYSLHRNVMDKIIRQYEDKITMKYAVSINNYEANALDVDLIISTIDMPFENNYVTIHPFLKDEDNRSIRYAIDSIIAKKRGNTLKSYLMNFFNEKLFYKNPIYHCKEDAIYQLTKDVIALDFAEDTLFEDVMAREKMSSTAFSEVAVPHSLLQSAKTSFISIVISDKKMSWGNQEVNIIALIGVNKASRKVFSQVFDEIIDILSEPVNVRRLIKVKDFNEFISEIKTLMTIKVN